MKTREEIESLKRDWEKDPSYEFEEIDGFEDHYEELKAFADQKKKEWKEKHEKWERDKAKERGLTHDVWHQVTSLEMHSKYKKEEATKTLSYYMSQIVNRPNAENYAEFEHLVKCIVDAAVSAAEAKILEKQFKKGNNEKL